MKEEQIEILKLITKEIIREDKIVAAVNRNADDVHSDIEELRAANIIKYHRTCGMSYCNLTQDGKRFLKSIGLI